MRNLISKHFPRLLAVLGCSTLVTACYGVPYDDFHATVTGTVLDAETGEPIRGISVKMTAGSRTQAADNPVQSFVPVGDQASEITDADGVFSGYVRGYGEPDGIMIECIDIDGEMNGSYYHKSSVFKLSDMEDIEISLERIDD